MTSWRYLLLCNLLDVHALIQVFYHDPTPRSGVAELRFLHNLLLLLLLLELPET
jgi:hypothetical protein